MKEPLIPGGYILLSRKVIESEIFSKPPLYMKVWVYLLSRAQHADYKKLKRGQLFISIPEIIEAVQWKIGYRTVKPTKDQIFQILNWLRKGNESNDESDTNPIMITTTKATHGLLINIENYSFYQDPKNYESNGENNNENPTKATREQRQSDNINKNVKNVKNDNKDYMSEIKEFLVRYQDIEGFNKLNKEYWAAIRKTRKSGKIAESVIHKNMEKWNKYDPIVVYYSLKTHVEAHEDKEEKYTIGIMRKTSLEEAKDRLDKKVVPFVKKPAVDTKSIFDEYKNREG